MPLETEEGIERKSQCLSLVGGSRTIIGNANKSKKQGTSINHNRSITVITKWFQFSSARRVHVARGERPVLTLSGLTSRRGWSNAVMMPKRYLRGCQSR